jgi:pentachlorophenol monooxygenase/3-(3-hydroxy-phenyl)propionate hydroxylase
VATGGGVVVVGNGPVGQTTALLLARWGIAVTVVDARPARDAEGSRAICQQRDVLDIWDAVGAGRRIAAEGVTWTQARTFYRGRELFNVTFQDRGRSVFPPFVNISQARTEEILAEQVAASPLVHERWGHRVEMLAQDDGGVTLTCATAHGAVSLHASYVVLCAGARAGALREALGVRFDGRSFADHFLICDIRADLPGWERERRFHFDPKWNPGRQVLIHPCPGSTYRIDWQVPPDFDLEEEERTGGLDRRIGSVIGEGDHEVVWRSAYRFHSRHADRMRAGRVLIAGDCAHLMSPFGARGLNSGVADAENAAWKLAFVLRGWSGEELLESYHDERHAAALENLEVTTRTMDFLVPQTEDARRRRSAVLERALADPTAVAAVDSGRFAEPFWYVDSPLTTPDPARPFPGRPARGETPPVVPGVLIPDVPIRVAAEPGVTRLREIARDGLLALVCEGADPGAVERAVRDATDAPVCVHALADLDIEGVLRDALLAERGEAWLVRPDGHVAAVVAGGDLGEVGRAVRRSLGSAVATTERG